jgi:CHASE3 domain sensor protein
MTRRAVRVTLLLLLAVVLVGAGVLVAREERAAATARATAMNVDVVAWRVLHAVSEARAGLQAYAVPGQSETVWRKKVGAALASATEAVDDLRNRVDDPGALNDLDAAAAALEALEQVDARASRLVGFDSRAQAGSLVFSDGLEAASTVTRRVESARQAEQQAIDRSLVVRRKVQAAAAGGAGLIALLVALVFAIRPGAAAAEAASIADATSPGAVVAREPDPSSVTTASEPVAVAVPAGIVREAAEIRATADICTDFARLIDSQELPALLARSAQLLEASGLIVWIADPERQRLRPLLAHGYPAQALSRLPAIPRDADNATAAAYRNGQVEVVRSDGSSPGAVVVPVVTGDGCIGVMAAEVRPGRETSETTPALARIVAAQLAAIVTLAPAKQADLPVLGHAANAE